MARQESSEEAPCVIFSQSSLTPIGTGFVLVEQRVTWQAGKDPVRQGNALVLADTRERSKTVTKSKLVASSGRRSETNGIAERAVRRV